MTAALRKSLPKVGRGRRESRVFMASTSSTSCPLVSSVSRFRAFSTTKDDTNNNHHESSRHQFDFRVSRLGLAPKWINQSCLDSILQLPEIKVALDVLLLGKKKKAKAASSTTTATTSVDSDLERACQVLESMKKGGNEHLAALAIRSEIQQRTGNHARALETVCQLETLVQQGPARSSNQVASTIELSLAKAKCQWYMGDFGKAEETCQTLLDYDPLEEEMPLQYASALTGYGLAKLVQCETLDDAFTVRDPLRMAVKHLERYPNQLGLALIAANLNLGVAEVVYGATVSKARDGLSVPIEPALKTWTKGMTVLEGRSSPTSTIEKSILSALQVRLESNLGWGVLKIDDDMEDIVPLASEYAGTAIRVLDKITTVEDADKEFLRRVLTIVATCYHKAGKAVTAEGLLQSATSLPSIGCTLTKLDEASAFQSYSELCKDWEKREADAARLQSKAMELQGKLPEAWQGKNDILSSAWFWTPDEFVY